MGPRSIDRGNEKLQEISGNVLLASMGPRSIDRGNEQLQEISGTVLLASMGPRSIDRGNVPGITQSMVCCPLQWGRDQLIAEMLTPPLAGPHSTSLQWGRDQLIAEIKTEALFRGDRSGFNGAAIN